MKRWSKNASLQLSIEAIVVLIIAITVLGLALGFVKNLFGGTFAKLEVISSQLAEEDKKRLESSSDKISMLSSEITVTERETPMFFSIRNVESFDQPFYLTAATSGLTLTEATLAATDKPYFLIVSQPLIYCYDALGELKSTTNAAVWEAEKRKPIASQLVSFETFPDKSIKSQRAYVFPVTIKVKSGAPVTKYSCRIIVQTFDTSGSGCSNTDSTTNVVTPIFSKSNTKNCRGLYEKKEFTINYKA